MRTMVVLAVMLLVAACGEGVDNSSDVSTTTTVVDVPSTGAPVASSGPTAPGSDNSGAITAPETSAPIAPPAGDDEVVTNQPEPTTDGEYVTVQVPQDLMDEIMADLAQHTGAAQSSFTVVRAESVIWNDGSLGCPEPGQLYTQALVNGYWVVIDHADTSYDYRASARGGFRLCESGGSPPSSPAD